MAKSYKIPYIDRVHQALTDNVWGFDKTPEEFKASMQNPQYIQNVHGALKDNVNGFDRPIEQFHQAVMQKDNTKVVHPIDNHQTNQKTADFLDWLRNKTSPQEADAFNSVRYENNNPTVNMIDKRSNYNPWTNTLNVDTADVRGPVYNSLAELAHARQFKDNPVSTGLGLIKDRLLVGDNPSYHTPNTVENQAHSIIQPQMKSQYQGRVDLNFAKKTSLANDKDFIDSAFKPIKY